MGYCKKRQKLRLITTLILLTYGLCTSQFSHGQQLNKQIDKSQKAAISSSPFEAAKGMYKGLTRNRKIRPQYLTIIDSLKNEFPQDTILLTENYDFICFGCPANFIQIQVREIYITLRYNYDIRAFERNNQKITKLFFDESRYHLSDIQELRNESTESDKWNKNPENYGTENCLDGGHTFYSFLYPNRKIISMYMRCWINKETRSSIE
jgi:hypothetical protein